MFLTSNDQCSKYNQNIINNQKSKNNQNITKYDFFISNWHVDVLKVNYKVLFSVRFLMVFIMFFFYFSFFKAKILLYELIFIKWIKLIW